jgi:lysozyme
MRQINKLGINLLKRFEGCSLTAYRDSGNILTIGIGHTGPDVFDGLTITEERALELLQHDLQHTYKIESYIQVPVNENQYSALVCLAFNIGTNAFKNSTLLKVLNSSQDPSSYFKQWVHVNSVVSLGLERRREAERVLFNTPVLEVVA